MRKIAVLFVLGLMPVRAGESFEACDPGRCLMTREQIGEELLDVLRLLQRDNHYLRQTCLGYSES